MTTQQTQEYVVPQGQTQPQAQRQSDPFWYRQNASYLYGVTSAPSNPALGIENISLTPASANQLPHGILSNGLLKSVIGSISFQIRVSKSNAPFVQTVSTPIDKDKGQYWEHIMLKAQVKAQILRFFEALQTGQVPQQMPQQQFGVPQQQFGMPQQQFGMPQQQYGMPMQQQQYNVPQQQFGMPMQQQQYAPPAPQQYTVPTYAPPVPQNLGTPQEQTAPQQDQGSTSQTEVPAINEEDLPV